MTSIAKTIKDQTDSILRRRQAAPGSSIAVQGGTTEPGTGPGTPPEIVEPNSGLAAHKASGDHDARYAQVFTDLNDAPAAYTGEGGKLVAVKADVSGLEFVAAPAAENGIPTGGSNNQLLAKDGTSDYVVKWMDAPAAANGLPQGGTAGQVLAKIDGADFNAQWADPPGASPFVWDATPTTEGIDRTNTSLASYSSMTAIISTYKPIKVTHIYWDIKKAGTYTLKMFGSAIASDVVVAADDQADVEFALTTPMILSPGDYKIWLHSSAAVVIDYNNSADYYGTFWEQSSALTNGAANNVLMPIKIKAYVGAWND